MADLAELIERVELRGYCTDCENDTVVHDGPYGRRCSCGSGRVIIGGRRSPIVSQWQHLDERERQRQERDNG